MCVGVRNSAQQYSYLYVNTLLDVFIHIFVYLCTREYMYISMYICVNIYAYVCTYILCIFPNMYKYIHYIFVYMYICVYLQNMIAITIKSFNNLH